MGLRDAVREGIRWSLIRTWLAVERLETGVAYNPFSRRYFIDPYPMYKRLREKDPIHKTRYGSWVLTRYRDVMDVFRKAPGSVDNRNHPRYERNRRRMIKAGAIPGQEPTRSLLGLDPPEHTRLRTLVNKAFTPRAIQALEPRIEKIVADILDGVVHRSGMDVIEELAYPLPVTVIAEMIGVPSEDREQFKRWSNEVVRAIGTASIADIRRSRAAGEALRNYFAEIAELRRADPRDDLLSRLLEAEEAGDRLTLDEVFATCSLLLVAGNETTTNLIGNGLLALLRHPGEMRRLRDDPSLMQKAVEELLRYDSPVQATVRIVLEDFEIEGHPVQKGQQVVLCLGAANRDPEKFPDPDRLDVTRDGPQHLSFGHGVHFCLGANLARLEARVALTGLLQRLPELKLASDEPEWGDNAILRGLRSLPVAW